MSIVRNRIAGVGKDGLIALAQAQFPDRAALCLGPDDCIEAGRLGIGAGRGSHSDECNCLSSLN